MTESRRNDDDNTPSGRRPWTTPRLSQYGHIGKLTQGASGTKADGGTTKRMTCL